MTDSLYFLFLDEIYTANLNEFRKYSKEKIETDQYHHHFGIAGVIMAASHLEKLSFRSRRIKKKFYSDKETLIFHYNDILNTKEEFSNLKLDVKKHRAFITSLVSLVQDTEFKYSCVFIDKHELIKKYGIFDSSGEVNEIKKIGSNLFPKSHFIDYNLYLLCLKKIMADFFLFITNRAIRARGIVVAEARGKREDAELREAFHKIHCDGISNISPIELRKIILDLFIVPKTLNYIGTQLADLVIYPTYDSEVSFHNVRNDHFIPFEKVLRRKLLKNGIIVIP